MDPNDPYYGPTCVVLHIERDEDARRLVVSGLGWRGGPKTIRFLANWAIAHPDASLANTPAPIRAYIEAGRS